MVDKFADELVLNEVQREQLVEMKDAVKHKHQEMYSPHETVKAEMLNKLRTSLSSVNTVVPVEYPREIGLPMVGGTRVRTAQLAGCHTQLFGKAR